MKIGLAREYLATSIEGGASSAQQQHFVQGFRNEFYSAGLDREYGRPQCRSLRGQDHWCLGVLGGQRLQITPGLGEQLHVNHETRQHGRARMGEVGARIREALCLPPYPPYHRGH